jgi:hypothetical protein
MGKLFCIDALIPFTVAERRETRQIGASAIA